MLLRLLISCFLAAACLAQPVPRRVLLADDVYRIRAVADPQVSPDGEWVAYTVTTLDKSEDKPDSDVWMVRWDGSRDVRMTTSKENESQPRWSPDGKWLAFLSARGEKEKGGQVWLISRAGGEAVQLTEFKDEVSDYAWSPDSARLALVITEKDERPPKEGEKPKTPKPIVIDRYHFKQDIQGYLTGKPGRIFLFDIGSKKAELLTTEELEEVQPSWSPDGSRVAFLSNRAGLRGKYPEWQVCVAAAKPASPVERVTSVPDGLGGPEEGPHPVWSKDGATIYFLKSRERKYRAYDRPSLASIVLSGGEPRILTGSLERPVSAPEWIDSGHLSVLVTDDMAVYPASVPAAGGAVTRLLHESLTVRGQHAAAGHVAVLASRDNSPFEIFALESGKLRPLTRHNQEWMAGIWLGETREMSFRNKDEIEVHGLLTLPPDYQPGRRYPLLLWIHGGPNGQDAHEFEFDRHLLAGEGYAVLQVNYRGSAGRDEAFQTSIFADWGNKEVDDLLAGVNHVIALGIADPGRLGIGGWSYGGILTDYTITRDSRFKAAASGAGSLLQTSMYGADQYVEQYDLEIGFPWRAKDLWLKLSQPYFQADKIRTPTLFLGGEKDFNVPIIGSEQMYQALKAAGIDTQLVIYPGEFHGLKKPSYIQDRLERYVRWFGKYLKATAGGSASSN